MADEKNVADEAEAVGGGAPGARGDDAQVESEEQVPVEGDKGEGQDGAARKVDDLPEWAQRELKGARDEAARYRTQLREVQESVKGLKTVEEFEAAMSAADEKTRQVEAELERVRRAMSWRPWWARLAARRVCLARAGVWLPLRRRRASLTRASLFAAACLAFDVS